MKQAALIYDPARHAANTQQFGQDPGVATLAFGAVALWLVGQPQEAEATSHRSVEVARQSGQPSTLALATHFAIVLCQLRGDATATERLAHANVELASREGFSFWLAGAFVLRGWAWVARCAGQGEAEAIIAEAGVAEIRRGLKAWLATGSRTYHTYYLGLLADALLRLKRPEEAFGVLEEATSAAESLPEGLYEAELLRLKGRALLMIEPVADKSIRQAIACFRRAVKIARAQGAKSFERFAAADLAATLRRQGRASEAAGLSTRAGATQDSLGFELQAITDPFWA
jgi:adenylate cyclase